MGRLSDPERAAYEAHISDLKDQIAWLRSQLAPSQALSPAQVLPYESRPWTSEEEEEVADAVAAGLIDATEAQRLLEGIGALNTQVEFA